MQTCVAVGVLVLAWCKGGGGGSLKEKQQQSGGDWGKGGTKTKCSVPQKETHPHIPPPLHSPAHPWTPSTPNSIPSKSKFPQTHSKPPAEMTDKVDGNRKKQEDRQFFPLFRLFFVLQQLVVLFSFLLYTKNLFKPTFVCFFWFFTKINCQSHEKRLSFVYAFIKHCFCIDL